MSWELSPRWSVACDETGLIVTYDGESARVRVDGVVAARIVAALSATTISADLSPLEHRVVDGLDQRGALTINVLDGDVVVARHEPARRRAGRSLWQKPPGTPRAHPTTVLARDGDHAIALGARSGDRVALFTRRAVVAAAQTFGQVDGSPDAIEREVWQLMHRAGLLDDGEPSVVDGWEHHDAMMHAASRIDTRQGAYGATFPRGRAGPAVPVARPIGERRISLPDTARSVDAMELAEALRIRRSGRDHGGSPIGSEELGALLAGSLRVVRAESRDDGELAWRPVPTGGARSGLGAVIIVGRSVDLETGVFDYDPVDHQLVASADLSGTPRRWLSIASRLTGIQASELQILVLLTLDYNRPAQKYERIVYSTALKEVGAVLQSMALVSAQLGLSFCPVGGGLSSTAGLALPAAERAVVGEAAVGRPSARAEVTSRRAT